MATNKLTHQSPLAQYDLIDLIRGIKLFFTFIKRSDVSCLCSLFKARQMIKDSLNLYKVFKIAYLDINQRAMICKN